MSYGSLLSSTEAIMGVEKERHPSVKESADDVKPPQPLDQEQPPSQVPSAEVMVRTISNEGSISPAQARVKKSIWESVSKLAGSYHNTIPVQKSNASVLLCVGIVLVFLVTISWTGATQFTKSAYSNSTVFNSPFFMVWFSTSWMSVCFPLWGLCQLLGIATGIMAKDAVMGRVRESAKVFGRDGLTVKGVAGRVAFFILFWFIANYSYSRALSYISASDVTAIFSSNLAFVYLLSLCLLGDPIHALKVLSIVLSIGGIVMMAYQEGFNGVEFLGVVLVVAASFAAAIYKVVFKRVIGDASFGQVSLLMTMIGLANVLLVWPAMLLLTLSGWETIEWDDIPWAAVLPSAVLGLTFNFLINLGIAVTHPLFVSVGIFLGYPLNAAVDVVFRDHHMGVYEIVGSVLIVLGFGVMLLPDGLCRRHCGPEDRTSLASVEISDGADHHQSTDSTKPIPL